MSDLQTELRAAFDAGVDAAERGFVDNPAELDLSFAMHCKHRAMKARDANGLAWVNADKERPAPWESRAATDTEEEGTR